MDKTLRALRFVLSDRGTAKKEKFNEDLKRRNSDDTYTTSIHVYII